jgi:hypothetical protein
MADTLIQVIEKSLGREPPKPHSEKVIDDRVEEYREKLAEQREAEEVATTEQNSSGYDDALVTMLLSDDTMPLTGLAIGMSLIVAILALLVFKLAHRNKWMRHSARINNTALSQMSLKNETYIWIHRTSGKGKQYRAFLKELKALVEEHKQKGDIEVDLSEGWRDN